MKVLLTKTMAEGFMQLLQEGLSNPVEKHPANILLVTLVRRIGDKLAKRVPNWPEGHKKRPFKMKDEEATALYCWYMSVRNEESADYSCMVVDEICRNIHQHYS